MSGEVGVIADGAWVGGKDVVVGSDVEAGKIHVCILRSLQGSYVHIISHCVPVVALVHFRSAEAFFFFPHTPIISTKERVSTVLPRTSSTYPTAGTLPCS